MRLLLIEDEPTLRESVAKKLRRSGYEMDDCGDGETALELLAAERYDLVLLDLNLPKVNGMTVLRTLRKTDLETPVLILSARSEISDKVEGLDTGANDYMTKPFATEELLARINAMNPSFCEMLPLTLEEIFINETEVAGYDVKKLLF